MRNLVFFEALAAAADLPEGDERNALEKELTAAIVVLRLFADWVDSPAVMIGTPGTLANIKAAVADVPSAAVRQLFETVVSAVAKGFGDPTTVAAPLLAYAWMLEERGNDSLAEDVLMTVANAIESLDHAKDYLFAATVNRRLGMHAHRRRDFDVAEFRHRRQLALSQAAGNTSMGLDARTLIAGVQNTRGNLGIAEGLLTDIIAEAQLADDQAAEAFARRALGASLMLQGQAKDALREYYTAYQQAVDWLEREWLLADIASCASMLGLRRLARIVFLTLSKTAYNVTARSLALVNLLEVAVLDRDRATFNQVVDALAAYELPRQHAIYAKLYRAMGIEQWEGAAAALVAYEAVVRIATKAGVHEAAFQAMKAVERLRGATILSELNTVSANQEEEWTDVIETVEADCRLRLQSALSAGE